jgi:hypothetical protein
MRREDRRLMKSMLEYNRKLEGLLILKNQEIDKNNARILELQYHIQIVMRELQRLNDAILLLEVAREMH